MDIENTKNPIEHLVHLYEDGAFNRRDLIRRVAGYTGSVASAAAMMDAMAVPAEAQQSCLDEERVPANAPYLDSEMVTYPGRTGTIYGYLTRRNDLPIDPPKPAVLVIHENRGLNEHIKDVARRVAKAGFIALAVDLVSRLGGTDRYPDPVDAQRAYSSLPALGHLEDLLSSVEFLKRVSFADGERIGAIGFCAGGGNCWNVAVNSPDVKASVVYYGTPPNPVDLVERLNGPVLCMYAQLDTGFTSRIAPVVTALLDKRKRFGLHVYEGASHAFNNDTGANYNPAAACDAWAKTIDFFSRHLQR